MVKFEENGEDNNPEQTVDNKLEFLKTMQEVNSDIKEKVGSDFVIAKLEQKDKEAVIEMTSNAYYCHKLVENLKTKIKNWTWNKEQKQWEQKPITELQKETLTAHANALFNSFMTRVYMTTILNRNVKNNWLMRLIVGASEEEPEEHGEAEQEQGIKAWVKDKMAKEGGA